MGYQKKIIIHGIKAPKIQQEPTTQKVGTKNVQKVNVQEALKNKRVTENTTYSPKGEQNLGPKTLQQALQDAEHPN